MTTTYNLIPELNGIEITFTDKPGDLTREELKKAGFRWHSKNKLWYAKQSPERLALAQQLTSRPAPEKNDIITPDLPDVEEIIDGGLYDGWKGGRYAEWRDEKELKALIAADLKAARIPATIRFNRAGYLTSLTVTVKLPADEIKPFDQWVEDWHPVAGRWLYYTGEDGSLKQIYGERYYYDMTEAEQAELLPNLQRTAYDLEVKSLTNSGDYHRGDLAILTDAGNRRFSAVQAIVTSYNRDQSNSMIDYFDRAIYDHYTFKIA